MHTTAASYADKELTAAVKRRVSQCVSDETKLPDVMQHEPSPALGAREGEKRAKYSRLLTLAQKQHRDGLRVKPPTLVPFILANNGELGPQATELNEWLVGKYRKQCKRQARFDGRTPAELTRAFRHKLVSSVQFAVAAGLGAMILTAGQPWKGVGSR